MIVNQENGPQRPGDAEVIFAVDQDHQSFNDHDGKRENLDCRSLVQHESSPTDPTSFQSHLNADQDKSAEFNGTVHLYGNLEFLE